MQPVVAIKAHTGLAFDLTACFWSVGGNRLWHKENMQTPQKGSQDLPPLVGDSANHCTTAAPLHHCKVKVSILAAFNMLTELLEAF